MVSTAITLLAVFDGENPGATVSFEGAMQWFAVSLVFSFPLALVLGLFFGLPTYAVIRRVGVLSLGKLGTLGISMGALGGFMVATLAPAAPVQSAVLGALAGLGAAFAWWFGVERRRQTSAFDRA